MWWILPLRSLRLRLLSQFAEPLGAARSEKKCFFTKAKLLGTGVLPLQELKVPTCREGAISAGRRLISHSHAWLECGGAAGFQASSAGVSKSVNTVHGSPSLHESHNFGAAESTCHWSPPLPKDPKPEAQRQKVRPCILKTLQDR